MSLAMMMHIQNQARMAAEAQHTRPQHSLKEYTGRPLAGAASRLANLASIAKTYLEKWRQ